MIAAVLLGCTHVPPDARSEACAECHVEQGAAWAESRHAKAATNALFAESFRRTDHPWCLSCHAADGVGVGCATCHAAGSPGCEGCHQFDLPRELGGASSGVASQDTVQEWRRSSFADRPCTSCHDPHASPGGHDDERMRAALTVDVRADVDRVVARLTSHDVGHAVPTGDPFRRLQLDVCADLGCSRTLATATFVRRLAPTEDGGWRLAEDTRVPPPTGGARTSVVERVLEAPGARGWRLSYHLADPVHEPVLGAQAVRLLANGPVVGSR
ncbi:MAG: hypothetical protein KC621_21015 [Myxococcales bacterium]|nr:hypothetical protein [Myxococcales bacterium]